jgi:di/tricarboxylate transporter
MDIYILTAIIALTLVAFVREWMPIDAVAFSCLGLLLAFDLVSPQEAIAGFSNPAVITVMMMFVLSESLTRTGLIAKLGHRIASLSGRSFWTASATLLVTCGVLSAFISNTATLAILMPVGIQLAKHYGKSSSRILLPLSYISIVGGTCTLIGTSTNLLVSALSEQHGYGALGMFEFLGLGAILFGIGLAYTILVPVRILQSEESSSLTTKYELAAFLTELHVTETSRLRGKTVVEEQVSERFRLNVLEIIRGTEVIATDIRFETLENGDRLIVRGAMDDLLSFKEQYGLLLPTDAKMSDSDLNDTKNILAELQLSPISNLAGQSIREIDFRRRYGCFVLALKRTGEVIRDRLTSIPLRNWDILLVFGPRGRVEALSESSDFVSLEEVDIRLHLESRWWIGATVIPIVVILASLGVMSILKASLLGAVTLIVTRALAIQEAYKAINWTVIFLLAAILPLATAMENTGLNSLISEHMAGFVPSGSAFVTLSMMYLATALLSEVMSNNSTAVLMVPISIGVATQLGLDPKPFIMAVAFGASASFLTPMGYQTNAMVFGPGGYRFIDYLRVGLPLKVLFWLVTVTLIPTFWPL